MSLVDELNTTVGRAKACAARCDADGLTVAMNDVVAWMQQHAKKLAHDERGKRKVTRVLGSLRDVASVMSSALAEALTAASNGGQERGYGRNRGREDASAILARRYG